MIFIKHPPVFPKALQKASVQFNHQQYPDMQCITHKHVDLYRKSIWYALDRHRE